MFRHKARTAAPERVHSISSLPTSVADDQAQRMRGYIISMSVRTACFVLAILVYLTLGWMWPALALMAGAVVLPYYAVVLANASANRQSHFMEPASPVREIGTAEDQHRSPGPGEHW